MNWEECKLKRLVKDVKVDDELINSLLRQSNKRLITDKFSPLNEETASTKVSNNYDALREVLEAIAIKNGFKIYNHECFQGFLKEILNLEKESFDFDILRKIRNSINYYGKDLSVIEAEKLIKDINNLRNRLIRGFI
jgi:hypothetical protein